MQVFVHGGVSGTEKRSIPSLTHALRAASAAASALDAVELAVMALEDDPQLNAGYGSTLNLEGGIELDAGIADAATGRVGAVANVTVRHPISLARRVMEQTPHLLLTGRGADAFAADLEHLADTTPEQRARWSKARAEGKLEIRHYAAAEHVDTVGAVARDGEGRLAAGSSTGGVFGKMPGRVGDAPIFGAGFYASKEVAVVGTGVGELFLKSLACFRVAQLVEEGSAPQPACERVIARLAEVGEGSGGLLSVDRQGHAGAAYRGGSWAVEGPDGPIAATRVA